MIESQISPELDGTGGGYGKYPGLTVSQIAEQFRFLAEEGQGRSVRAVLRTVHEQTEARGGLGTQRILAVIAGLVTVGLVVLRFVLAEDVRHRLDLFLGVSVVMTLLFTVGAVSVHRTAMRGEAQVREIRRLALETLDYAVAKPGFKAKSLEREHWAAFETLKKVDPAVWQRVRAAIEGEGSAA